MLLFSSDSIMMSNLPSFLVFLALPALILCNNYSVKFDDEEVIKPCVKHPENFFSSWVDMSQLKFESLDDDEIRATGYFVGAMDFKPNDTFYINVEVIRKAWGKYNVPVAQVTRFDLCKAMYNPNEVWYGYTSMTDPEKRHCPLQKGVRYDVDNWSTKDFKLSIPDPALTGAYRIIITLGVNNEKDNFICAFCDVHLYKK